MESQPKNPEFKNNPENFHYAGQVTYFCWESIDAEFRACSVVSNIVCLTSLTYITHTLNSQILEIQSIN